MYIYDTNLNISHYQLLKNRIEHSKSVEPLFNSNMIIMSNSPYHLVIDGEGFFMIQDLNHPEKILFTRNGEFNINHLNSANNSLINSDGFYLLVNDDKSSKLDVLEFNDEDNVSIFKDGLIMIHNSESIASSKIIPLIRPMISKDKIFHYSSYSYEYTGNLGDLLIDYPIEYGLVHIITEALESNFNQDICHYNLKIDGIRALLVQDPYNSSKIFITTNSKLYLNSHGFTNDEEFDLLVNKVGNNFHELEIINFSNSIYPYDIVINHLGKIFYRETYLYNIPLVEYNNQLDATICSNDIYEYLGSIKNLNINYFGSELLEHTNHE